jgi:hypothetical protein
MQNRSSLSSYYIQIPPAPRRVILAWSCLTHCCRYLRNGNNWRNSAPTYITSPTSANSVQIYLESEGSEVFWVIVMVRRERSVLGDINESRKLYRMLPNPTDPEYRSCPNIEGFWERLDATPGDVPRMSQILEPPAALNFAQPANLDSSFKDDNFSSLPAPVGLQDTPAAEVVNVSMGEAKVQPGTCASACTNLITIPCCAPFWPCCILDAMLGCCGFGCGCRAWVGDRTQTVEFDPAKRTVTLREFTALYCACEYTLVREQRLPIDCIDSFKCAECATLRLGSHAVVVAVKRSLTEADRDGVLSAVSAHHSHAAVATGGPPYVWPALIERDIFAGGDLLLLSYLCEGSRAEPHAICKSNNLNVIDRVSVCNDVEKLLEIVEMLNVQLTRAKGDV